LDYQIFKKEMKESFKLDLNSYKEKQLLRRINVVMNKFGVDDYRSLLSSLEKDRSSYGSFIDGMTINVTEFFRDKALFGKFEAEIIPGLLEKKRSLKVWSAACANGAEPYSVAIILNELTPGTRHTIDATDLDENILRVAAAGFYPADLLKNVSPPRTQKYFKKQGERFALDDQIKRMISFRKHDLLLEPFRRGYDLIVCRNVMIYFTKEAQFKVNTKFAQSLNPGGILFTGGSETIFDYGELGFARLSPCFYRKL